MITRTNTFLAPVEKLIGRYQKYIGYLLLLLACLSVIFLFDEKSVKQSGGLASMTLWIILWIPIFARVFGLRVFAQILPLRKELGILMGVLAIVHGFSYMIPHGETMQLITDKKPSFLFFGVIAMWLSIPLLFTSSSWAMRKLGKYWKMLHRTVYIIALFMILHIALIRGYKYMDFGPIIFFCIYLGFKILEWRGFTFAKKENKTYPIGQKWLCLPCGYIYDPLIGDIDSGIVPGTEFSDIPNNWRCPVCGVTKSDFVPYTDGQTQETISATVVSKKFLNPTTIELIIETADPIASQVGQFVSFVWQDEAGEFTRQYSIVRQTKKQFTFLIKLDELGRGSHILRGIVAGADIRIKGVFGTFRLQESKNPKVFIATGTGLAPIYAMICSLPVDQRGTLYFSAATALDLFYLDELRDIEGLDLHIHTTREEVPGYSYGRVDVDMIPATPDTEWYFCGNPRMVTEAVDKLTKKGYTRVYREEF